MDKLLELASQHAIFLPTVQSEYPLNQQIPNLTVYRHQAPTAPENCIEEPFFGLILQGGKRVVYDGQPIYLQANQFILTAVDIPLTSSICVASPNVPYLALIYRIDLNEVTKLIAEHGLHTNKSHKSTSSHSTSISIVTPELWDAFTRLLILLNEPGSCRVLEPLIRKEIYYRLLQMPQGEILFDAALSGTQSYKIRQAIAWLHGHFCEPFVIKDLAEHVQMSPSSFHSHFRKITGVTPLQFQKQLRLQEARRLMLSKDLDAAAAAYRVGYESASQFSREYSRLFSLSPVKDKARLRQG